MTEIDEMTESNTARCYCPPEDADPCCGLCEQGVDCSLAEGEGSR